MPRLTQHGGRDYELAHSEWVSLADARSLSYDLPATEGQPLVEVGHCTPARFQNRAVQVVRTTGGLGALQRRHIGSCGSIAAVGRSDASQSVTITELREVVDEGTLYVLVYEPVE